MCFSCQIFVRFLGAVVTGPGCPLTKYVLRSFGNEKKQNKTNAQGPSKSRRTNNVDVFLFPEQCSGGRPAIQGPSLRASKLQCGNGREQTVKGACTVFVRALVR